MPFAIHYDRGIDRSNVCGGTVVHVVQAHEIRVLYELSKSVE
jgi:hypothetical protein